MTIEQTNHSDMTGHDLARLGLRGRPGERLIYHRGNLMRDRTTGKHAAWLTSTAAKAA